MGTTTKTALNFILGTAIGTTTDVTKQIHPFVNVQTTNRKIPPAVMTCPMTNRKKKAMTLAAHVRVPCTWVVWAVVLLGSMHQHNRTTVNIVTSLEHKTVVVVRIGSLTMWNTISIH